MSRETRRVLVRVRQTFFALFILFIAASCSTSNVPLGQWQQYATPEEAGWSSTKLEEAKKFYDSTGAAALMVVFDGKVLVSWGDVTRRYMCHSVRKSFLSGLYGTHVDDGTMDLNKTLKELNIDDDPPLTEEEKQATVKDLLKARSGVYIPAAYENEGMRKRRPERGSHKPGTFWYYNNWDFNVLCTILEQVNDTDIFVDFKNRIADPIGMEDYRIMDGYHHLEPEYSTHAAYPFRMSARDMARFGQLFLQEGSWNGKQVISKAWINKSTAKYSHAGGRWGGYGYLWWLSDDEPFKNLGTYYAAGTGLQLISVLPGVNLVIVQRVDTYIGTIEQKDYELFKMILDARVAEPKPEPKLIPLQNTSSYQRPELVELTPDVLDKYVKEYDNSPLGNCSIRRTYDGILLVAPRHGNFRLLPTSASRFVIEDAEQCLLFKINEEGIPSSFTLHQTVRSCDLYEALMDGESSSADVAQKYHEISDDRGQFSMSELLDLGQKLIGHEKLETAIEVLKLEIVVHPEASILYETIGQAYMRSGNRELALSSLRKSLELMPGNERIMGLIEEIEKQ